MKLKEVINKLKFWDNEEDQYLDDEIDESLDEEISDKDKKAFKKLNKKVIAAMVSAALLISAIAGVSGVRYMKARAEETEEYIPTVQVFRQDVQKTMSATGTIISAEESGQFATVSGSYPVQEVYVKVGDEVKKGDPLYKLDMTTMEETLSYQQQALNIQNQQNAISQDNANRALQDAQNAGAVQITDSTRSLDAAKQEQNTANRNKNNANDSLNNAKDAEDNAKSDMDSASSAVTNAQNKVNELNTKIANLESQISNAGTHTEEQITTDAEGNETTTTVEVSNDTTDLNNQLTQAKADLEAAKTALSDAKGNYDSKKGEYNSSVTARQSAEQAVQSANDSVTTANRSVDAAQSSLNNTTQTANSTIVNQAQSVKSSQLSSQASTLSSKQEIEKSQQELSKAVVCASQDGTVTNVNIVAGQTYSGTDAVVIDNVTSLKATADIDEGQIPDIAVGQKVEIKTDATGDDILTGTVTFVSPTATKNSTKTTDQASTTESVSKSRATYRVDVSLDEGNEKLRLGMTAKMTFITAESKNALVVPSSDIQTDMDGNKYVVVQKDDETTENVNVTVGISDDFYTEITDGDLKENDIIVESDMDGSADAVLDEMGADGGIYFE